MLQNSEDKERQRHSEKEKENERKKEKQIGIEKENNMTPMKIFENNISDKRIFIEYSKNTRFGQKFLA